MIWFVIAGFGAGVTIGLYIGRRLGIKETEHKLHVLSGKKAIEKFRKETGLSDEGEDEYTGPPDNLFIGDFD